MELSSHDFDVFVLQTVAAGPPPRVSNDVFGYIIFFSLSIGTESDRPFPFFFFKSLPFFPFPLDSDDDGFLPSLVKMCFSLHDLPLGQ